MNQHQNQNEFSYEFLSLSYEELVRFTTSIARDFEALLGAVNEDSIVEKRGYSQNFFHRLSERAKSELLSIAFFGSFTSGKSFLISGLNNKIDWFEHKGRDLYAPILAASPLHTSNCPVAVEPSISNQQGDLFSIFFEGSENWEQRSPATPAIIQAYVTDLPNAITQRLNNSDRQRNIIKAKLNLSFTPLKARFYDLPGFGSVGANFGNVIREFITQADCLVYVAWAVRPMVDQDLELLRDIYNHHKQTGKPVFFVLTQIDRAWDYDITSGKIAWEVVKEANDDFLRKNFVDSSGVPDQAFIGDGFIPVSPALEAKAIRINIEHPNDAQELLKDSRMQFLRDRFNEYLQETSGPMHLAELACEMQKLLSRLTQDLKKREESEAVPLTQVHQAIKSHKAQRSKLVEGKPLLQEQLEQLGRAAISRAFAGSDPDDLTKLLNERLSAKIQKSDVLKESNLHLIETEKANIVREWVVRDKMALIPKWVKAWEAFIVQSNERVEQTLANALLAKKQADQEGKDSPTGGTLIDVTKGIRGTYTDPREQTAKDTLDIIDRTWKAMTVIGGIGASGVAGSVATFAGAGASGAIATALGPIGWGIMATAAVSAAFGRWKHNKNLNERRKMMIDDFPNYAENVVNAYKHQAGEFVQSRVGVLIGVIDSEYDGVEHSINTFEQRLHTGEFVNSSQRLQELKRLSDQCNSAEQMIKEFFAMASKIQSNVTLLLDEPIAGTSRPEPLSE